MKIDNYYPLGVEQKSSCPLCIDVFNSEISGVTIKARSQKRKDGVGTEISIFLNNKKINCFTYGKKICPSSYHVEMACDIHQTVISSFPKDSIFLDISGLSKITEEVIKKCEFHNGINLSSYDYEALVTFY